LLSAYFIEKVNAEFGTKIHVPVMAQPKALL